jgi:hypothetical protein
MADCQAADPVTAVPISPSTIAAGPLCMSSARTAQKISSIAVFNLVSVCGSNNTVSSCCHVKYLLSSRGCSTVSYFTEIA